MISSTALIPNEESHKSNIFNLNFYFRRIDDQLSILAPLQGFIIQKRGRSKALLQLSHLLEEEEGARKIDKARPLMRFFLIS